MAVSDERGNGIFSSNGNVGKGDGKETQKHLMERMLKQQLYMKTEKEKQYVLRESVLECQYGTKYALLDCSKDHGILKNGHPLFTILDCLNENIHNFGSCLCPEKIYKGRLPMTAAHDEKEKAAKKAPGNEFAHICAPIVDKEDGWKQVDKKVLIEVGAQGYFPMLLDDAVLVCQRGGIIFIKEAAEVVPFVRVRHVTLEVLEEFGFFMGVDDDKKEKNLAELHRILNLYNITTYEQIAAFMGQVAQETGFGIRTLEHYETSDPENYFNENYSSRTDLGNNGGNDGELYRGAGYLHLTGKYNYQEFGKYMGKEDIVVEKGYRIVGGVYNRDVSDLPPNAKGFIDVGEYAWESAGWYWAYGNPEGKSLNEFVENHDWWSVSHSINEGDAESYPKREQNTKDFYLILTGKSLDAQ